MSSQGSISEGDPRQSRPFRSVFVPTAVVSPVRSTASLGTPGQSPPRKGRGSMRKSKWWQRGACAGLSGRETGICGGVSRFPNTELSYWVSLTVLRSLRTCVLMTAALSAILLSEHSQGGCRLSSRGSNQRTCCSRASQTRFQGTPGEVRRETRGRSGGRGNESEEDNAKSP